MSSTAPPCGFGFLPLDTGGEAAAAAGPSPWPWPLPPATAHPLSPAERSPAERSPAERSPAERNPADLGSAPATLVPLAQRGDDGLDSPLGLWPVNDWEAGIIGNAAACGGDTDIISTVEEEHLDMEFLDFVQDSFEK